MTMNDVANFADDFITRRSEVASSLRMHLGIRQIFHTGQLMLGGAH